MLFRPHAHDDATIWVDRGIDDLVEPFQPCTECHDRLGQEPPQEGPWRELELCHPCQANLDLQGWVFGDTGLRIPNREQQPETITYEKAYPHRLPSPTGGPDVYSAPVFPYEPRLP